MCGIVGVVSKDRCVTVEDLTAARDTMRDRGPDDAGIWVSPDRSVGLAHRRLAVIDLSPAAHQPLSNEDGSLWIVYNGEVYNYRQLRTRLMSLGRQFRSRSDTEVVLRAYEEWGSECLSELDGIFAFAIWDVQRRRLFAARDRLGVKPFYYWQPDRCSFAFASQLKALMRLMGSAKSLDLESVWWYLATRSVPSPRAILRNCRSLPPGHCLTLDADTAECIVSRYWSAADIARQEPLTRSASDLEEELDGLLLDAVRRQLVADVPVGAFLSGGLDSTCVAAMMRRAGADTATFSIGFTEQFDEAPHAAETARHLGTRHRETYVSEREMRALVPDLPGVFDEPLADSSMIPTIWLSRFARESVTVALSGDGGDEIFGGYAHQYARFLRAAELAKVPRRVRQSLADMGRSFGWSKLAKALNVLDFDGLGGLALNLNACWRPRELDSLLPIPRPAEPALLSVGGAQRRLSSYLLADLLGRLPDEYLTKVDRASMSCSLEVRVPLLDQRLVEFALRLPIDLRVSGHASKVLLRRVMARYVPPEILNRPKRGFGAPMDSWLRGDLRWMLDDYLDPVRVKQRGLFDARTVQRAKRQFLNGSASHYRVWALVVFEMWADKYGIQS